MYLHASKRRVACSVWCSTAYGRRVFVRAPTCVAENTRTSTQTSNAAIIADTAPNRASDTAFGSPLGVLQARSMRVECASAARTGMSSKRRRVGARGGSRSTTFAILDRLGQTKMFLNAHDTPDTMMFRAPCAGRCAARSVRTQLRRGVVLRKRPLRLGPLARHPQRQRAAHFGRLARIEVGVQTLGPVLLLWGSGPVFY